MTALSLPAARALHLAAQGLLAAPRRKARPADVLATIRRMALLQIDTISVVARSPYLVLWSRLGDYQQQWLDDALAEGQLFEYWAHEACFLPIEDYGLLRHRMVDPEQLGWKSATQWRREHPGVVERVLQHIQHQGAMRSADFEQPEGHQAGWWNWKPEKRALEVLFASGELMVARRQGFQRVYDLRERVLPGWQDAQHLQPVQDCKRQLVLQAVKALGVAHPGWVADYYRMGRLEAELQPSTLARQGLLLQATLAESGDTVYIHPDHAELLDAALAGTLQARGTRILSPFDPVVWDRKRANALFQFDYRLECYTPAPKRQYGYFVLPILRNGALIGRMDAKAHRQQGRMEVKALHLEAGVRASQGLARDLVRTLLEFARWHATPEVQLSGALPDRLAPLLHAELASQA
ncbi:winged helix-turn-helix domain-containing protein [Leeia aquatica]|uniref:Winged helix-turn-helix domain-containing protein n=1 Tax=Leeia aquatica TaxID=2725557 RepID=A0A847SH09_9NEIS|nr:crosslink repair DNA glycosylase YcaQ family protein [Leeia aquatica]NLR75212.1 winged helix-turn-helix domain-containing protein [Leeia aquatica]